MASTLTRPELHVLVWTQPRSVLAKQPGVSGAAIAKACARSHIPCPPRGHWPREALGKAGARPDLPICLPGHSQAVSLIDQRYAWPAPEDLAQPIFPPVFTEQAEDQVRAAMKSVGKVAACRDLSDPHRCVGYEWLRRSLNLSASTRAARTCAHGPGVMAAEGLLAVPAHVAPEAQMSSDKRCWRSNMRGNLQVLARAVPHVP